MNYNVILNAADVVLSWDLPDEALPEALGSQARFMSGIGPEGFEVFRMHYQTFLNHPGGIALRCDRPFSF